MGSIQSNVYSYDILSTDNIHDLKFYIKNDNVIVSYHYSTNFKQYLETHEKPFERFHEETLKLTNKEALKMNLFIQTALNKKDCVNLGEYIWKVMKK